MPSYEHECFDENCKNVWEDFYSITKDPPETCPKCNGKNVRRLISGGSGRGIVELTGNELVQSVKQDAQRIQNEASRDAKKYANLIGEAKYEQIQQRMDKQRR